MPDRLLVAPGLTRVGNRHHGKPHVDRTSTTEPVLQVAGVAEHHRGAADNQTFEHGVRQRDGSTSDSARQQGVVQRHRQRHLRAPQRQRGDTAGPQAVGVNDIDVARQTADRAHRPGVVARLGTVSELDGHERRARRREGEVVLVWRGPATVTR